MSTQLGAVAKRIDYWRSTTSRLTERGVTDHSLEQGRDDYRRALVLTASRLATAVATIRALIATPDGFWNVVFPRYARALADLDLAELVQQRSG
jgi:hypothetical protein